jgi:hypothetical protein
MKSRISKWLIQIIPTFGLALLVLLVLDRANPYTTLPTRDSGCYLYIGRLILRGELPYINAWDSKPPAIFYINALGLWLGKGTRWGVWVLESLFIFSAALIGYRLLRRIWKSGPAIFGMVMWMWGLDKVFWKGDLIEEFSLLFSMAAILFFWLGQQNTKNRIYDFLIGAMTLLSFLFRANNIGTGIAVALSYVSIGLLQRDYISILKRLGGMLAGAAAVLLITTVLLWQQGILGAAWNAAILYNFSYVGNNINIWWSILQGFQYLGMLAWICLLGYSILIVFSIKMIRTKSIQTFLVLPLILWPVEIILSSLSGRGYMHYFVNWLPSVALLCGYLYLVASPWIFSHKMIAFMDTENIPLIIATIFAMILGNGRIVDYYQSFHDMIFNRQYGVEEVDLTSLYIRRNTEPNDKVLDWGQGGINYMSQRDAPTAYLWYPEYLPSKLTTTLVNGFYDDILKQPPEIIVDSYLVAPDDVLSLDPVIRQEQLDASKGLFVGRAENVDLFFQFVSTHYAIEKVVDGHAIYRLVKP